LQNEPPIRVRVSDVRVRVSDVRVRVRVSDVRVRVRFRVTMEGKEDT